MSASAYRSGGVRAQWTMLLLGITVVASVMAVAGDLMEHDLFSRIAAGERIDQAEAEANDTRQGVIGLTQVALYVATAIAFIMWLHRAHANLPALGATGLKFSPGGAVGWWFVPIANMFQPYRVVAEVWRNSNPAGGGGMVVGLWWVLFVGGNIIGSRAGSFYWDSEEPIEVMRADALMAISDGIDVVGAAMAIIVVLTIDRWQSARGRV